MAETHDPVMREFDGPPPELSDTFDVGTRLRLELNDRDNGRRLRAALEGRMLYVPGRGWGVWDGRRFDFEAGEELALEAAGQALPRMLEEEIAAGDRRPLPEHTVAAFMAEKEIGNREEAERRIKAASRTKKHAYAVKCGNSGPAKAALEWARPLFRVESDDLDRCALSLTCQNGVLDLELVGRRPEAEEPEERAARLGGALGPHDPARHNTRRPAVAFDPAADCPRWREFVGRAFPDAEAGAYLQRALGHLLSGDNAEQVALILLGQGGNGKSTLANMLQAVLGGYAATCRIDLFLEQRFSGGQGPTPEEAVLPGARVYVASEPEAGAVLSGSKVKGMTGGEARQSRPLHGRPFTWTPVGVPVLSFNKMPRVTDESEGMWRRLMPVHFPVALHQLPPAERVAPRTMLRAIEEEASGILNWLLEGWVDYRDRGLDPPADVLELKAGLRAMSDPVGEFLADTTERRSGAAIAARELHQVYERWCAENGAEPLGQKAFSRALAAKDLRKHKSSRMEWLGLAWLQSAAAHVRAVTSPEEGL